MLHVMSGFIRALGHQHSSQEFSPGNEVDGLQPERVSTSYWTQNILNGLNPGVSVVRITCFCSYGVIVPVRVVLKRTVVGD